ncbi:hypothetical protein DK926_19215 [Rhodococcus sp. Eu-32]|uniref:hypothetical protein n=1 Tax=Rhodococcus sp. Eu-32 TaxID=1017319 RepID=UPI000DF3F547|nr:hypothetical protein [Rhodococcus sp. Eu-32]RRQ26132.1 hypothetical protein DK926_19215 [Rhodococcus sp. Eu-32]
MNLTTLNRQHAHHLAEMQRDYTEERADNYRASALELYQHKQAITRICVTVLGTLILLGALTLTFITSLDQSTAFAIWLGMLATLALILGMGAATFRASAAIETQILSEINTARTQHAHRRYGHD